MLGEGGFQRRREKNLGTLACGIACPSVVGVYGIPAAPGG
jgi:hypothetical protein